MIEYQEMLSRIALRTMKLRERTKLVRDVFPVLNVEGAGGEFC